jgi:replicative DNA helicase
LKNDQSSSDLEILKDVQASANVGEDRIVHFTEYIQTRIEKTKKLRVFASDFPSFDEHLGGLMTSEVTVISGRTGEGKTLFAESWMKGLIAHNPGLKVCVFSYEVAPEMMLEKYVDDPLSPIYLPLTLETMKPQWLIDRVREAKVKYDCKIFIFDHLHFLVDMQTKQNMSLNMGAFMRILKQEIAVKLNVAPILIAHQGQPDKKSNEGEPSIDSIRDSSFIAQEADNVIIVWRKKDYDESEIAEISLSNPVIGNHIRTRQTLLPDLSNPFLNQFATVQIAKARRKGTYRWKKAFQKVGNFLEEI